MPDDTEEMRRELLAAQQAAGPATREQLEETWGKVWDTEQLQEEFEVVGFMAPYVVVKRKKDGVKGSMMFQHHDRYYYNFEEN